MNVADMVAREDFARILADTLSRGWTEQYGSDVEVRAGAATPGQRWVHLPLIDGYAVPDAAAPVRRFLRDLFRYTPVRRRAPAQWLVGTLAATPAGIRVLARPGFSAMPPLPDARWIAVVPGNQRVRTLDFARGTSRVFLKQGFDPHTMRTEIALRASGQPGPFPPIVAHDERATWFEEPVIDAYALPRCPPWFPRRELRAAALRAVENWAASGRRTDDGGRYAAGLRESIEHGIRALRARFGESEIPAGVVEHADALVRVAAAADEVVLAPSHGDLQPGNVLVDRRSRAVTVIDWEHCRERSSTYDRLVLLLGSRSGGNLNERIAAFLAGRSAEPGLNELPDGPRRVPLTGVFLLEELDWYVRESLSGPYLKPSAGLGALVRELGKLRASATLRA